MAAVKLRFRMGFAPLTKCVWNAQMFSLETWEPMGSTHQTTHQIQSGSCLQDHKQTTGRTYTLRLAPGQPSEPPRVPRTRIPFWAEHEQHKWTRCTPAGEPFLLPLSPCQLLTIGNAVGLLCGAIHNSFMGENIKRTDYHGIKVLEDSWVGGMQAL